MTVEQDFSTIISDQADRQFKELVERSHAPAAGLGSWQPALWESMEASGLALALVPEDQEGAGLDARSDRRIRPAGGGADGIDEAGQGELRSQGRVQSWAHVGGRVTGVLGLAA